MWIFGISNEWMDLCVRGSRLDAANAEVLETRISAGDSDLPVRLQLIGYCASKLMHPSQHVLSVIESHPTLPLHAYWGVDKAHASRARELWEGQFLISGQPQILANAAWSLASCDEPWAEACYRRADADGEHAAEWWYSKAALFELLADAASDELSRRRHSATLLKALLQAFALEGNAALQLKILFPARQAAVAASDQLAAHQLLVLADAAGTRASRVGLESAAGRQCLRAVRGFLALARGATSVARVELEAAEAEGLADDSIVSLARELERHG